LTIAGANKTILEAATTASHDAYAYAYHMMWVLLIPLVIIAIVAVIFLQPVGHLMTNKIEATVERTNRIVVVEEVEVHFNAGKDESRERIPIN
jgi:hypothetical protein